MSLILGVHLATKLYLVSDTRATKIFRDGRREYSDDLVKVFALNGRISAVEAGDAAPTAFILKKLKARLTVNSTMESLKAVINTDLRNIISDYVNSTGRYGNVALIIGGFNPGRKKKIESSVLGNAMAAPVIAKAGTQVNQTIPRSILDPLGRAVSRGFKKGDYLEIDNLDSEMIAIKINIRNGVFTITPVDCFQYVTFHPNQPMVSVAMPQELISNLEFRERTINSFEDLIYPDAEILMSFVSKAVAEHQFETVGGNILVGLISNGDGIAFPLGDLARIRNGQRVQAGSIFCDDKGNLSYILEDGRSGQYRYIESLDDSETEKLGI